MKEAFQTGSLFFLTFNIISSKMKHKILSVLIILFSIHSLFAQKDKAIVEKHELFFENNVAELNTENITILKTVVKNSSQYEILKIKIDAHCDSKGSHDYNHILSKKRAESVFQSISSNFHSTIELNAHGKNQPKYQNQEEYKNRRVDIEIYKIKIPIIEKKSEITAIKVIDKNIHVAEKAERNATQKAETLLQAEVGETISFEDIQFHPGTPTPLQSSIPALKALANILLEYANLEIEIQGHICCALVDDADISTKRSLTVYNFLIESGIEASRLKYKGYGRSRPKTQERTPEEKQMNRRVEIKILKK